MIRDWLAPLDGAEREAALGAFEASGLASPARFVELGGDRGHGFRRLGWAAELALSSTWAQVSRLVEHDARHGQPAHRYVLLFSALKWSPFEPLSRGASLIELACSYDRPDVLAAFHRAGFDPWSAPCDEEGLAPLTRAAYHGAFGVVDFLSGLAGLGRLRDRKAALIAAASNAQPRCVGALIRADVADHAAPDGSTALNFLCQMEEPVALDDFVKTLALSNPDLANRDGRSAMVSALADRQAKASRDAWSRQEALGHPGLRLLGWDPSWPLERYALAALRSEISQAVGGRLPEQWARELGAGVDCGGWLASLREGRHLRQEARDGAAQGLQKRL